MNENIQDDNQGFVGKRVKIIKGEHTGFVGIVIQQSGNFIKIIDDSLLLSANTRTNFVEEVE